MTNEFERQHTMHRIPRFDDSRIKMTAIAISSPKDRPEQRIIEFHDSNDRNEASFSKIKTQMTAWSVESTDPNQFIRKSREVIESKPKK